MSRLAVVAALGLFAGAALAQDQTDPTEPDHLHGPRRAMTVYTVGSGDLGGGYYETARALCNAANRVAKNGLRCSPASTPGSIYNLAMLQDGELDFAFAQSDWQRAAYEGTDLFAASGPMPEMRSVMALYPETLTILARPSAGIDALSDLAGKTVDLGPPASGRHATVQALLRRLGIGPDAFIPRELTADQAIAELCAGRIDATVLVIGHPNATVADGMDRCGLKLVPFDGPHVREVLAGASDFVPETIPAGTYLGQDRDLSSFAVYATIVTHGDTPDAEVTALVTALTDNLDALRRQHPVLGPVDLAKAATIGLTAPLHPAAAAALAAASAAPGN